MILYENRKELQEALQNAPNARIPTLNLATKLPPIAPNSEPMASPVNTNL